jgi:hypothetical protein
MNPFAVQQVSTSDRIAVGIRRGARWYFPDVNKLYLLNNRHIQTLFILINIGHHIIIHFLILEENFIMVLSMQLEQKTKLD